jgi:succinate dehydrogenase / fumarate reductase flavoprotein subunit
MYHQFKELADVDITAGPMEVGPTCHYVMGGIRVDAETAQASIPGLFAAGEAAGGMHGANRLGGNSLSDLLVFGRRAGLGAAAYAQKTPAPTLDSAQIEAAEREVLEPFNRAEGENPYTIHSDLQEVMQNLVGIFRIDADLRQALVELDKLKERASKIRVEGTRLYNPGWHLSRDVHNMLVVSEACTHAALARRESRGAHSRLDFPKMEPEWSKKNHVIVDVGGKMTVVEVPRGEIPAELQQIIAEDK